IPGASRSGVTITGGLFRNMTRETAARFSFLLSLPAVFAAGVKELIDERKELLASHEDVLNLVVAIVISGLVGYASIAWLIGYLKKHTTYIFIGYRIGLGGLLIALLLAGKIPDQMPKKVKEPNEPTIPSATSSLRSVGSPARERTAAARLDG